MTEDNWDVIEQCSALEAMLSNLVAEHEMLLQSTTLIAGQAAKARLKKAVVQLDDAKSQLTALRAQLRTRLIV